IEDNPDIDKYIPPWIFTLKFPVNSSIVSLSSSYDLHYKRGYFQIEINRRITKALSLYVQYRNGYGESLIDYDLKNSRIMFGMSLLPYFELNR
ncbi:phospholipase A, partial [Vibrio navarrensis]|nr:phospholipase A [Vibrio navarrensis]